MKSLFPSLVDSDDEEDNGLSGTGSSSKKLITNRASGMSFYPDVQLYGRELFEQELQQQIPVYVHPDDPNAPLPNDGYNPVLNRDSLGDFDGMMYEGLSGGEVPKAGDQVYIPTAIGYDDMGSTDAISSDEVYSFEDHSKNLKKQASASLGRSVEALHQKKENAMSRDRFTPNAALDDGRNMGVDYSRDFYNHSEYGDYVKETPKVAIRELGDPLSEIEGESKNPVVQFNSLPRFGRNINSSRFSSSITDYLQNDGRLEQTGFGIYENAVTPAQEGAIIVGSGIDYATASMGEIFDEAEAGSEGLGNVRQGHEPAIVLHNKALQKALLSSYNKIDRHQDMQEASEKQVKKLIQAGASQSIVNKQKANALAHQCAALQEACSFIQTSKKLIQGLQGHLSNKGLKKNQAIAMREDLAVIHAVCNSVLAACFTQAKDASQKAFALCQYWGKLAQAKPENKLAVSMLANCKKLAAHCKKCLQACSHFAKNSRKASMGAYTAGSGDMGLARQISGSMGAYTKGSGDMGLARQLPGSMGAYTKGSGDMGLARQISDSMGAYTAGSGDMGLARQISESMGAYTKGSGDMGLARQISDSMGAYTAGSGDMGLARQISESMGEFGVAYDYDLHDRIDSYDMESDNAGLDLAGGDFLACYGTLGDADHDEDDNGLQGLGGIDGLDCVSGLSDMSGWLSTLKKGLKAAVDNAEIVVNPVVAANKLQLEAAKKLVKPDVATRVRSSLQKHNQPKPANQKVQAFQSQADAKLAKLNLAAKSAQGAQLAAIKDQIATVQKVKLAMPKLIADLDAKRNEYITINKSLKTLEASLKLAPIPAQVGIKNQIASLNTRKAAAKAALVKASNGVKAARAVCADMDMVKKKLALIKPAYANLFQAFDKASANALVNADIKQSMQQLRASELSKGLAEVDALIKKGDAAAASVKLDSIRKVHDELSKFVGAVLNQKLPVLFAPKTKMVVKPMVVPTKAQIAAQASPKKVGIPAKSIASSIKKLPKLVPGQSRIKANGTKTKALIDTRDERAGIANLKSVLLAMSKYQGPAQAQLEKLPEGKLLLSFINKSMKELQALIKRCDSNIEVINHFNAYLLKNKKPVAADGKKALEIEKTINLELAKAKAAIVVPFKRLVEGYTAACARNRVPAVAVAAPAAVAAEQLPAVVPPTTAVPPQPQIPAEIAAEVKQHVATEEGAKMVEVAVQAAPTADAPEGVAVIEGEVSQEQALVVTPQQVSESIAAIIPEGFLLGGGAEGDDLLSALRRVATSWASSEASAGQSMTAAESSDAVAAAASEEAGASSSEVEDTSSESAEEVMQGFTDWLSHITP